MKGIYWFRYDLRLDDNPSFAQLCQQCDQVLCVYVLDQQGLQPTRFQTKPLGAFRRQFILESLIDLKTSLQRYGQELYVLSGDPYHLISQLIEDNAINRIGVGCHPGHYEVRTLQRLMSEFDDLIWHTDTQHTLWRIDELDFELASYLGSFSRFRKQVEHHLIHAPVDQLPALPHKLEPVVLPVPPMALELNSPPQTTFKGGEQAALMQLQYYLFKTRHVLAYKQTRNQLEGWDFSSKLSAWLSQGCVSPKRVVHELRVFESEFTANESTYWLYFELLWREYFQWLAYEYGAKLFAVRGIRDHNPLTTFYAQHYQQWMHGNTESDFVNALMHQLNKTGWMSNRGRQIVASYCVNELALDWRYGAAYFEQQLIDYDVASNWGNWQYLAGVGTDPRGKRHFNTDKQAKEYDPGRTFTDKWLL